MHLGHKFTEKRAAETNAPELVQYTVGAQDGTRETA